jgi:PAS domain S-box-containing protein
MTKSSQAGIQPLHLAAIVQWSDDAIFSKGLDGVILSWNRGAERMYGYTAPEAVGRHVTLLVPEELRPEIADIMARVRRGEPVEHYQTRRRSKDGTILHVSVTISPIKDEHGLIVGASTIARDITDRVQAQEREKERMRELERTNGQLKRLNAELERFVYVVAHDLKEPARQVGTYTELLKSRYAEGLSQEADEVMGFILSGARRMHALIRDLLAFSRIGQNRRVATVEPGPALKSVLEELRPSLEEAGAEVTSDTLPPVEADRGEFRQILHHLLENAVKFRAGPPRVHISAARSEGWVRFSVRDNGIGIEPEHRERVFVLFKRLKPVDDGTTGTGLAICRKIVGESGGRIWVEDAPGGGSTFLFTLPEGRA